MANSSPSPHRTLLRQSLEARQCDSPEPYESSLRDDMSHHNDDQVPSSSRRGPVSNNSSESVVGHHTHQEARQGNGHVRYAVPRSPASRNNTAATRLSSGTEDAWSGSYVLSLGIYVAPE